MTQSNRIVFLGEDARTAEAVRAALADSAQNTVSSVPVPLASMNGKAVALLADHDMMILDVDPEDAAQLSAITALADERGAGKTILALTGNDVSLATVRQLRGLGIDEVLPRDLPASELKQSIEGLIGLRLKQLAPQARTEGIVLTFTQARGGVGATTVAVNLAHALAAMKPRTRRGARRRVVVVDLDIQFGSIGVLFDIEDNGGLMKLIESPDLPDANFMRSVVQHHASGLDIFSAPVTVAPLTAVRAKSIGAMLDALKAQYDYVIVDLPRALVEWIEPVLQRSDRICIVTDTSVPCVRQARRVMDFFRESNAGLRVELIVNRETRPLIGRRHMREAEQALGTRFGHWLPDNAKAARRSADLGRPVVEVAARTDLGRALQGLAGKLDLSLNPERKS